MILKAFLLLWVALQSADQSIADVYKAANADMDAERWAEAIPKFEQVVKGDPTHIPTRFNLAVCYYKTGHREKAVELYTGILADDPGILEARVNLGLLLQEDGNLDGAAEQFEAMVALEPDLPANHLRAASMYLTGNQVDRAYPHLLFAEKNGAPSVELYSLLSEIDASRGDDAKSLEHLEMALVLDPENPTVQRRLGVAYFNKKDYTKAVPVLEGNVRRDPTNTDDLEMLATSYFDTKRYRETIDVSIALLTAKPDSVQGFWTMGWAFYELQDWTRASSALLRYIRLKPNQPIAHFVVATCFDQLGNISDALLHYNRFLELDDKSSDARSFQARERVKALERRLERR